MHYCMYNYKTHSRCMNYFNVSCTKPQTALIKLCSVYTLVVTILIHMYCTVHCLICNYHQLEMIINSLAMADGSSNDFKILMNYQSCMAKLITNLLKYYHWNFRWNSTHFCRLVFIDSYASKNFRQQCLKDLRKAKDRKLLSFYFQHQINQQHHVQFLLTLPLPQ